MESTWLLHDGSPMPTCPRLPMLGLRLFHACPIPPHDAEASSFALLDPSFLLSHILVPLRVFPTSVSVRGCADHIVVLSLSLSPTSIRGYGYFLRSYPFADVRITVVLGSLTLHPTVSLHHESSKLHRNEVGVVNPADPPLPWPHPTRKGIGSREDPRRGREGWNGGVWTSQETWTAKAKANLLLLQLPKRVECETRRNRKHGRAWKDVQKQHERHDEVQCRNKVREKSETTRIPGQKERRR